MTNITFYKTNNSFVGFRVLGHSGYAEEGSDIVCAGISVLAINFINSVDSFTNDKFILNENPDKALIEFKFKSKSSEQSQLLFITTPVPFCCLLLLRCPYNAGNPEPFP